MDSGDPFDNTVEIVRSVTSVEEGMRVLLDYSASVYPSPIWANLKLLDYTQDAARIRDWLERVLTAEPPPSDVKAFWFGIYKPVDDEQESRGLYVSGSTTPYSDDDPDWACWDDDSYLPEGRYAPSKALAEIYRSISGDDNLIPFGEYTLCLGYCALAVKDAIRSISPSLLLVGETSASGPRDIGIGFDDGDYFLLGTVGLMG